MGFGNQARPLMPVSFMRTGLFLIVMILGCHGEPADFTHRATGMKFVLVPAGSFVRAGKEITISEPFYLGAYEVTQGEWQRVMGANPSHFRDGGPRAPVEEVNWLEVQEFVRRLGAGFRLPTEAEWEYACRAGTLLDAPVTTAAANYDGRYPMAGQPRGEWRGRTTRAGSFSPNAWGLYDMRGNVWEWCEDDYCAYAELPDRDPVGRCHSGLQVIRGGSWYFNAESARCGTRYTHRASDRGFSLGFRVVRDAGGSEARE